MAQKCVHKGCGKTFTDPDEPCVYHSGPPEFHEGQKGWKCCKPRVLTFDEFLAIPPCTTGKHSTVDDTPPPPAQPSEQAKQIPTPTSTDANGAQIFTQDLSRTPLPKAIPPPLTAEEIAVQNARKQQAQQDADEDSDDESTSISQEMTCKRKGCGKTYDPGKVAREDEQCVYHPGVPLFHEGSKGWTCCKRRVLEFDQFMKIEGCKDKKKHCYVGKKGDLSSTAGTKVEADGETLLEDVRSDFYQTTTSVIVSFYLKKIDKERAKVEFVGDGKTVDLDLPTSDGKRFVKAIPLYASIDPKKSQFRILGTKLELTLIKADGTSWTVLRSDQRDTGERIQIGRAGKFE